MLEPRQLSLPLSAYQDALARAGILVSASLGAAAGTPVRCATDDSRQVGEAALFVCKGAAFKRDYLLQAIERGAIAYVSASDYDVDVPALIVSDIRRALAIIADLSWDHPSRDLAICALTGTKGKTTTAYYLKAILDAAGKAAGGAPAGLLSSIAYFDGIESGTSKLTTPEAFELERRLADARAAGLFYLVMEASSQALKFDRTYGLDFAVGAFLNIGEDHISPIEHPTFEDYFASKLKIFQQSRTAVVNLDMDHAEEVLAAAQVVSSGCVITFSLRDAAADVFCSGIRHEHAGVVATVRTPRFTRSIAIPTPVRYNVANALAAIACAEALGIDADAIGAGLATVRVPGRMELYPSRDGRIVGVVDYAHNGMSLEALLTDLRESYPDREFCVVFGATGGKGLDRRETMGAVAGRLADRIVITEDDPGPEDPADIAATIARFVEAEGNRNWRIELDRPKAILTAVRETTRDAVVIVTGKGHETRMLRNDGAHECEADGVLLERALSELA